ncbi:putative FK506-binding protein [Monocercomonoides exilis]|uniref:putative FK506-binding protein n=1 Tax=Monocercomonoides exilis TaxID=2049356 RepID=UPI003559DB95|nr:putative FK506-binding protein [Monocercomonoides exilis]|eukprot:MONOS_12961.1-p1 / transcript=MONOS_12961.1 / gene=MONOS_12961 / organism=Monocercomonoides_exilis_PA203 / gene_product=RE40519p / transcript_product=RE40519p / location=Mono_scaffold00760:6374-7313(-) / protein_length=238 / sequence_SO=supercontig / SO=protein_coding / is_pseudo=false
MGLIAVSLLFLIGIYAIDDFDDDEDDLVKQGLKPPPPKELKIETIGGDTDCYRKVEKHHVVRVHYIGRLYNTNEEFDNSYKRDETFEFLVGEHHVIKGWEEGVLGMCTGEKRHLIIPPKLGYGRKGVVDMIPPDSTLEYDIELVSFDPKKKRPPPTAKERLERKRKHDKLEKMRAKMKGEDMGDGSTVVNYSGGGPGEEDEEEEDPIEKMEKKRLEKYKRMKVKQMVEKKRPNAKIEL